MHTLEGKPNGSAGHSPYHLIAAGIQVLKGDDKPILRVMILPEWSDTTLAAVKWQEKTRINLIREPVDGRRLSA
jgi:hypothetical protein